MPSLSSQTIHSSRQIYLPACLCLTMFLDMSDDQQRSSTIEVHGYALRMIREARGRKVADLAAGLQVDRSYITHLENGSKRTVGAEFYARLLAELQIRDHRALLATAPVRKRVT